MKNVTIAQVERKRREFSQILKDFRSSKGRYHNPAPELPEKLLAQCKLLPSRVALIDRVPEGQIIGMLGVSDGNLAAEFLARANPIKLHLFGQDLSRLKNPDIRAELASEECRIKPQVGDTSETLARFPDQFFDTFYIDGDHSYEAVSKDIERVLPKVKPNGALIFHSYSTWSTVTMYHCGVARAVHELCLEGSWRFQYLALEPMMYYDLMLVRENEALAE